MRNPLAVIGLVLLTLMVGALAITPASAAPFGATGAVLDGPVYTEQASQQVTSGKVQVQVTYAQAVTWQWDEAETSYLGTFPVGIGATMKVYPNVLADMPVVAMVAAQGELEKKLEYSYDRRTNTWSFTTPGVLVLKRDAGGRWYLEMPLEVAVGADLHCFRFYALVQDGKRNDKAINLILFKIKWAGKTNLSAMVDTLRFKTECWPANCSAPSVQYLTDLLRRAGNGGNGLVFETLLANDKAMGSTGTGLTGGGITSVPAYDDSSLLVQIANLEARVAACEAFDLKVWEAIQVVARNSGKTEAEIQRLRQLVANHQLTLVQVIEYLKAPAPGISSSVTTQKQTEVVHGNYCFRTSKKVWIRLYDRAYPQGRVFGPYAPGDIPINNAAIGERVNGNLVSYEYNLKYSTDGRNWSEMITYRPGVSNVIVLPL